MSSGVSQLLRCEREAIRDWGSGWMNEGADQNAIRRGCSSSRALEWLRSLRNELSCLLRLKAYGAYPAGAAFGAGGPTRWTRFEVKAMKKAMTSPRRGPPPLQHRHGEGALMTFRTRFTELVGFGIRSCRAG